MSLMNLVRGVMDVTLFAVGTLMIGAAVAVKQVRDLVVETKGPAAALAHRYKAGFRAFFNAIREANDELDGLQAKRQRDGGLNEYDQMAFDAARERRSGLATSVPKLRPSTIVRWTRST